MPPTIIENQITTIAGEWNAHFAITVYIYIYLPLPPPPLL